MWIISAAFDNRRLRNVFDALYAGCIFQHVFAGLDHEKPPHKEVSAIFIGIFSNLPGFYATLSFYYRRGMD